MGRQICFYIVQEDFNELLKVISKNGGKIIYEDGSVVDEKVLANMMDQKYRNDKYKYDTFYNRVKRYITKNYIISEDKGYYIGPYCYELYLEGKYIPCNGRYRPIFRKKD